MKKKLEIKNHEASEYKKQLNQYSAKYVEIQKTIKESNKTFEQIRSELTKLKARNEQLEKEKVELKKVIKEVRMTGISSPSHDLLIPHMKQQSNNQLQQSVEVTETPKLSEEHNIDIAATPKTIIDIQTPIMFSPTRVSEEIHASSSLLHTNQDDLNDVEL